MAYFDLNYGILNLMGMYTDELTGNSNIIKAELSNEIPDVVYPCDDCPICMEPENLIILKCGHGQSPDKIGGT